MVSEIRVARVAQSVQELGYRIDVFAIMLRLPARTRFIFVLQNVQTGSGAHLASYSMGNEGKAAGR
jgi:DNA-binding LacI/PurR family transcriptional regulator